MTEDDNDKSLNTVMHRLIIILKFRVYIGQKQRIALQMVQKISKIK